MEVERVIVIGAGPAGLAAAMQLRRHGLDPLVFERDHAGGLLLSANLVENYPGFPDGITGPDLAQLFARQSESCGVRLRRKEVTELDWKGDTFHAITNSGIVRARAAVVASGTKPKSVDFPIPDRLRKKIFYEIYSILHMEGKRFVIIGGGDAAFDYALNLGKRNTVGILNRGEDCCCLPLLRERAKQCPNIDLVPDTTVCRLNTGPEGGLQVECSSRGSQMTLQADFLIAAIGRNPNTDFLSSRLRAHSVELHKQGLLAFAGDVKNGSFRQTAIAVGDGIKAGMRIHHTLRQSINENDRINRKRRNRPRVHR